MIDMTHKDVMESNAICIDGIEFVKVVRCKECKHWVSNWEGCRRNPSVEHWREEDFCNYGERRNG